MITHMKKGVAAGFLIAMGCIVFLKVGGVAGAALFSAGLWFVVNYDAELFTGRVTHTAYTPVQKAEMLVFNLIGAGLCGLLAGLAMPDLREAAAALTAGYAEQSLWSILWKSAMCGVCMYLATTAKNDRILHVVYGVMLFILSGYAHSIALAGYAAIARQIAWWVIPAAAAGNAAGSYAIKWLLTATGEGKKQP